MSLDLWQQAKQALAEVMEMDSEQREKFLAELQQHAPDVHQEVVSLLSSQATAEAQGFMQGFEETIDQYGAETLDPNSTLVPLSSSKDAIPQPASAENAASQSLAGEDYELDKKIGQGGMGVVYKAYHRSLRRTVALKIITGGGLRDEIDIARFRLEAEAAARLDHPGIIPVYDVGENNGNHYYAMAYVEGPSLSEYVGAKAQKLAPRRAAELIEQVCHAVQYAHDRAVIHRDLKPANIMLEGGEVPRLADFGLAKNMHEEDGLTMTGQVMGTPSYMAPEQASGSMGEISNRTDVYSLGATLYALLAGRPPFSGNTVLETIQQVVRAEAEPLTQIVRTIPRDLQTICEKCLAKSPDDRYDSADELAQDLRRYLDGFPISARPLAPWARGLRWCQRNPVEAFLLGVTATTLILGTIVSVRFGLEANRQANVAQAALQKANENAQNLRQSIKDSFIFASEDVLAQEPGMQAARAMLLETAQRYYAELVTQTPHDADSQQALAEAQFMLSKVHMTLGKENQAKQALDEALKIQQTLVEASPKEASTLTALAKTHNQLARLAQRRWQNHIQLQQKSKPSEEQDAAANALLEDWLKHAAKVVRLRKIVVAEIPDDVESQRLLASAIMNEGIVIGQRGYVLKQLTDQDRARRIILEAQEIRQQVLQNHPDEHTLRRDLARGFFNLANAELRAADLEQEEKLYQQRLETTVEDLTLSIQAYQNFSSAKELLDARLEIANCFRVRADANVQLLVLYRAKENAESSTISAQQAAEDYKQAEKKLRLLVTRNPNVYRYRVILSQTQANYSQFLFFETLDEKLEQTQRDEKHEQLIRQFGKCRSTLLQAVRTDPANADAINRLVRFTQHLAEPIAMQGYTELSAKLLNETLADLQSLENESTEYLALQQPIQALLAALENVQKIRAKKESPDDVL